MKHTFFRRLFGALALLSILSLTACHTVAGFGEDIQKSGQAIQRAAD